MGDITDIPEIQEIGETIENLNSGHRLGELSTVASKVVSRQISLVMYNKGSLIYK